MQQVVPGAEVLTPAIDQHLAALEMRRAVRSSIVVELYIDLYNENRGSRRRTALNRRRGASSLLDKGSFHIS